MFITSSCLMQCLIVYASKLRKLGPVRWCPQPSIAGYDLKYAFSLTEFGNMIVSELFYLALLALRIFALYARNRAVLFPVTLLGLSTVVTSAVSIGRV